MQVCIRRLALCQLYSSYAQTPYIGFVVVARLFDYFGGHPVGCADEGVFLGGEGAGELARDTKVGELDIAVGGEEDVRGCMRWGAGSEKGK
jgi:hypothetical protein